MAVCKDYITQVCEFPNWLLTVNWESISPEQFEELCYHLLESMGFANLKWHGKAGSDRGRDLTAQLVIAPLQGSNQITEWVVQCKRYPGRPPSKQELDEAIVSAKEHNPTDFLIITTAVLTSATHDWLDSERKRQSFHIEVWESPKLEVLLRERIEKLRPWIPEELRRELKVGEFAPPSETTRIEDILRRSEARIKRSVKEQIFGTTEILQGEVVDGTVYGQTVILRPGCLVKGDIYARREVKISRGSKIDGSVLSPGDIELIECELDNVCASQITMKNPSTISGRLVTDRDLSVPADSKIVNISSNGKMLEIGERSEIGSISCRGVTILGDNVKVMKEVKSADIRFRQGCQVGWAKSNGDLSIPENTSIGNLSTDGSVKVDAKIKMTRLYASGDVELPSGSSVEELRCRNLSASGGVAIRKLRAAGVVNVKGEGGTYAGTFLGAGGEVFLPDGAEVEVLSSERDVVLGRRCRIKYLVSRSLTTADDFDGGAIRCKGSVELGENCKVESLYAVRGIKFKEGFRSAGWTIFSEKGAIQGRGVVKLGDTEVLASAAFRYKEGTLLTALVKEDQMKLIEGLEENRS